MLQRHLVRLACIRHAASVHPEPGSNSPQYFYHPSGCSILTVSPVKLSLSFLTTLQLLRCCSVFLEALLVTRFHSSGQNSTSFPAPVKGLFPFNFGQFSCRFRPALPGTNLASIGPAVVRKCLREGRACPAYFVLIDLPFGGRNLLCDSRELDFTSF